MAFGKSFINFAMSAVLSGTVLPQVAAVQTQPTQPVPSTQGGHSSREVKPWRLAEQRDLGRLGPATA